VSDRLYVYYCPKCKRNYYEYEDFFGYMLCQNCNTALTSPDNLVKEYIAKEDYQSLETKLSKAVEALKSFTRWEPKGVHLIPDKYGRFMDAGQVYQVIKELEE
jgi:hypothetical protein